MATAGTTDVTKSIGGGGQYPIRKRLRIHEEKRTEQPEASMVLCLSDTPVGGHLRFFTEKWKTLTSDKKLLHVIQGQNIELTDQPHQS